jgi:5-(carboxyamino)imidazole ribonucleotide synthase
LLNSEDEIPSELSFPVVLKARRHGYDGQGTFICQNKDALEAVWNRLQRPSMLLEDVIPFERELAVIAARSLTGEVIVYPVVETQQEDQVCRRVIVSTNVATQINLQIVAIAQTLLEKLDAVGVFGIELFLTRDQKIFVNEIAPRTHNSGHYTMDACDISQFEMLLRIVANLPLRSPIFKSAAAVMVNLLGYEKADSNYQEKRDKLAALPNTYVHWYGKTESRPGRKMGHVNVLLNNNSETHIQSIIQQIESIWYG